MGREIRRVPADWKHPFNGDYQPMFDESYEEALAEWRAELSRWLQGTHEHQTRYRNDSDLKPGDLASTREAFIDWWGEQPDPIYHRPAWTDEQRTHFQVYETVTEGTPISPVLPTKEAVVEWLVANGDPVHGRITQEQAVQFVKDESAPSMVMIPGVGVLGGIQASTIGREK